MASTRRLVPWNVATPSQSGSASACSCGMYKHFVLYWTAASGSLDSVVTPITGGYGSVTRCNCGFAIKQLTPDACTVPTSMV